MSKTEQWVERNMPVRERTFTLEAKSFGVEVELRDHGSLRRARLMHPSWSGSYTFTFLRKEYDDAYSYLRSYISYRAGNRRQLFPMELTVPFRPDIAPASPECRDVWTVRAWSARRTATSG